VDQVQAEAERAPVEMTVSVVRAPTGVDKRRADKIGTND
jgi:hypothetical protein